MSLVFLIFIPILAALFIPLLFKRLGQIHTGWFVLLVPAALFLYYATRLPSVMEGGTYVSELS